MYCLLIYVKYMYTDFVKNIERNNFIYVYILYLATNNDEIILNT